MGLMLIRQGPQSVTRIEPSTRTVNAPSLVATAISDTEIRIDWVLPDQTAADNITFERSANGTTGWTEFDSVTVASSTGQLIDTDRTAGTIYYYRGISHIFGTDPQTSPPSLVVNATTTNTTPNLVTPTSIIITETARTSTTVTWTLSWSAVTGASSYDYALVASGGTPSFTNQAGTSVVGVNVTRLADDLGYTLQVRARNASGPGPLGTSGNVIAAGNLKAPNLVSATVIGSGATADVELRAVEDANADTTDKVEVHRANNTAPSSFTNIGEFNHGIAQPQYTDNNPGIGNWIYKLRSRDDDVVDRFSSFSANRFGNIGAPPVGGFQHYMDFTTLNPATWAQVMAAAGYQNMATNQILFDDGSFIDLHTGQPSGLGPCVVYAFKPLPTKCNDQNVPLLYNWIGNHEVWIIHEVAYATNWTTQNAFCQAQGKNPDYKMYEAFVRGPANPSTKHQRYEFKHGLGSSGNNLFCGGDLHPLATIGPSREYEKSSPIAASSLWDNQRHVYKYHFVMLTEGGVNKQICQSMVDGTVVHSFKDIGEPARSPLSTFKEMHLGHNRNLGATEEMYMRLFTHAIVTPVQGDPGWFAGVGIADWADNGGAIYIP